MSEHASTADHAAVEHGHEEGHAHKHPPYMKIFFVLASLTLIELAIPLMFTAKPSVGVTILLAIAVWKILLIIRYFMHLKFDAKILGFIATTPAVLASIMAFFMLHEYML